ncbi:MAG: glycosyl transferase family 2 [Verrucomicrobiaceae bacterium]|nr:glycosyl transferase family 2 [Verrucomicrobiaceae bacterium]
MSRNDLLVSVILPLQDDARILDSVVRETSKVLADHYTHHEIILVADGSDAETCIIARAVTHSVPAVRLIMLSREFGREMSVLAGLESSIGDYVVVLIPETDPPSLIPEMVARCREVDGMVLGVDRDDHRVGLVRRTLKRLFHSYMRRSLKTELLPGCTDFCVMGRRMVNALTQFRESYRQLRLLSATVGYHRAPFPYTLISRTGRNTRRSFIQELHQALEMVVAHSRQPLRIVSWLGWIAGFINILYTLYVVLVYLLKKDVAPGWTSQSFMQGVMFFCLFTLLSILSEYIGRILEESRGRPLYFVTDEMNSPVVDPACDRPNVVKESR